MRRAAVHLVLGAGFLIVAASSAETPGRLGQHLAEKAGLGKGVCAVLGCPDPQLAVDLAVQGGFLVHVLDPAQDHVAAVRSAAEEAGLDITRLVAERSSERSSLPYADNVVDLIVACDATSEMLTALSPVDVLRALRPGGKAFIRGGMREELAAWAPDARVAQDPFGVWAEIVKPSLEGVDNWSHWEHGPDNNPVSTDQVIKAPYMTQWLGRPYYITMPAITTVAGGRTFLAMGHIAHHEREEKWLNTLVARNGYNGVVLWERRLPDGYLVHRSAFIATDDTFYMIAADGGGCVLLDPETGQEKERIRIDGVPGHWKWMAMEDGVLFALAGGEPDPRETTVVRSLYSAWSWNELSAGYYEKRVPWGFGKTLLAYDLERKRLKWCHLEEAPVDSRAMAMGGGHVYFYGPDSHIGCLDAATGDVVWLNDDRKIRKLIEEEGRGLTSTPGFRSACFCVYTPKGLFYEAQTRMNIVAVSRDDGSLMWHRTKTTYNPNVIYLDGNVLVGIGPEGNTLVVNPATGETVEDLGFKKRSCVRLTATPDSLFCRGWPEGTTRYDRNEKKIYFDGSMRPACNDGVIGANGLLYSGPWLCDCNLSIMGSVALCSAGDFAPESFVGERVEATGHEPGRLPFGLSLRDWFAYRGGNGHSGSSEVELSRVLLPLWTWKPKRSSLNTAPTTAGGYIFFGNQNGQVRALDAATGDLVWTFATAGPIMQPPSLWRGRAFVGSGDGHVYALDAATGRLLWKFRAAPFERRTMIYGALQSTWPVNSGVLVHKGTAYFAAGIIDYDGTYIYAVDAESGDLKWANNATGHLDKSLRKGVSAQGNITIMGGALWLAAGNVMPPAPYSLDTGEFLERAKVEDGSPRTNRGEEIGVFADRYLVNGGRLRFSTHDNIVNPGGFAISRSGRGAMQVSRGRVAPAWDGQRLIALPNRDAAPIAYETSAVLEKLKNRPRLAPRRFWEAKALRGSRIMALALAADAVVVACETPVQRSLYPRYRVCLLDRDKGSLLWEHRLDAPPLLNGLAIDRDGRIVVPMEDGSIAAWGRYDVLRAAVEHLAEKAKTGDKEVIKRLRYALSTVHDAEGQAMVLGTLEGLGVDVLGPVRSSGGVYEWHLMGPVPWDENENRLDKSFIGEPNVGVTKPCVVDGEELAWQEYVTIDRNGMIDLTRVFGDHEMKAIYAYAVVELPQAGDALLKVGSNDGFLCWFNGEEAGRFDGGRTYGPDQDILRVKTKEGLNHILVKITQLGGGWALGVRITDTAGKPIPSKPVAR